MKQYIRHLSRITENFTLKLTKANAMLMRFMLFALITWGITSNNDIQSDLEQARLKFDQLMQDSGNVIIHFPDEDPGIPIYARVGPILNQFLVTESQLVIPFYRDPDCIPESFNLLSYYDPPTAFGCELTIEGKFVIENDANEGDFPIMVQTEGVQVPVWIVDWVEFQDLMENESVTLPQIEALNPIKGIAQQYEEYLSPRMNEHEVIIEAGGTIQGTDQQFTFSLTHRGDQIESITLNID